MIDPAIIIWGVPSVLFIAALLIGWTPLRSWWKSFQRERLITRYGVARLDNVVIDDGIGGSCVLEHVLLRPSGLLLLMPRECNGALFGATNIDSWTQMREGRSYHFENPLRQLEELLAALRCLLPGIPVEGSILYTGKCEFPKGRPDGLLMLEEMRNQQGQVKQGILPVLEEAWKTLQSQPQSSEEQSSVAPMQILRIVLAVTLLLGSVGWLLWQLVGFN